MGKTSFPHCDIYRKASHLFVFKIALYSNHIHRIIESWNRRMAWVEKDLKDHLVSIPLPRAGLPATRPGCPEPHLAWMDTSYWERESSCKIRYCFLKLTFSWKFIFTFGCYFRFGFSSLFSCFSAPLSSSPLMLFFSSALLCLLFFLFLKKIPASWSYLTL